MLCLFLFVCAAPLFVVNDHTGEVRAVDFAFNAWGGAEGGCYSSWDNVSFFLVSCLIACFTFFSPSPECVFLFFFRAIRGYAYLSVVMCYLHVCFFSVRFSHPENTLPDNAMHEFAVALVSV